MNLARLKCLLHALGEAINESLSESKQVADLIAKIRADGGDVNFVLEATSGGVQAVSKAPTGSIVEFKINAQDVKFLRSLRISAE